MDPLPIRTSRLTSASSNTALPKDTPNAFSRVKMAVRGELENIPSPNSRPSASGHARLAMAAGSGPRFGRQSRVCTDASGNLAAINRRTSPGR